MLVFHADRFGYEVFQALARHYIVTGWELDGRQKMDQILCDASGSDIVFAMGHPRPRLMSEIGEMLVRLRLRWTAAVLRDRFLICGPLHKPGQGACWECMRRRWLSQSVAPRTPDNERALDEVFDKSASGTLDQFLPPVVGLAVAAVRLQFEEIDSEPAGAMTVFDMLDGGLTKTRIVPLHGCFCRGNTGGSRRFVDDLATALRGEL